MAYTPKSSSVPIPCQIHTLWMPHVLGFTEIASPSATEKLKEQLRAIRIHPRHRQSFLYRLPAEGRLCLRIFHTSAIARTVPNRDCRNPMHVCARV